MTARAKLLAAVVVAEVVAIALLGFRLAGQRGEEAAAVIPLQREQFTASASDELKYFYEPKPSGAIQNRGPDGGESVNTINADTLNERFDYAVSKPPGTFRILSLGDSYAYGLYVNTEENYAEVLEDALNAQCVGGSVRRFEVLNLGVPGYDLRYTLERLTRRGLKYDPDLVIWFLENGDINQNAELIYAKIYPRHPLNSGNLAAAFTQARAEVYRDVPVRERFGYQKSAFASARRSWGGRLVLFSTPAHLTGPEYKVVGELAALPGVSFVELAVDMSMSQNAVRQGDNHPNAAGHNLITRDLFTYLTNEHLIPCA